MINEKGEMIISEGKTIRENILESDTFPRETAHKMINRENGIEHVMMDGKEKLIAYHGLTTVPWSIAVVIDAGEVISPALMLEDNIINLKKSTPAVFDKDIKWIAVIAGFILVFIITGVLSLTGQMAMDITEPIEKLTIDAARIGTGDLEHTLEVKTGDELELLATSFNSMISGIKTISAENERLKITSAEKTHETEIIQGANKNLQSILDMLPISVRIMNIDDYSMLYVNKALLDVFNCTSMDQMLGHNILEFMPVIQPNGRKTTDMLNEYLQKESVIGEMQYIKLGGDPFTARIHSIITAFNGIRAALTVIEDVPA
jgi:nitrogen fixation/metabolism regulation signal transduction histidine kinase